MSPKILAKAPYQGHYMEKKSVLTLKRNTTNICTKFRENIMNGSKKIDVICQNRPQNTPKWPPEERDMVSKKKILVLLVIRVIPRTPVQIFMRKYSADVKKIMYICQNGPKIHQNGPQQMGGRCLSVATIRVILRTTVQSFMRKY